MDGWIRIYKKMLEWEWYTDVEVKVLFIHLLLIANFSDTEWRGISIKRGQAIVGRSALAKDTGLSEQNIRTAFKKLEKTGELTSKSTNKYSIVTLNNYDKYNPTNQQSTSNQPATNQQLTTLEEYKEDKEKKNTRKDTPPLPPKGGAGKSRQEEIKEIWQRYSFSPQLQEAVKAWGAYKKEKRQEYKPQGLKTLLNEIQSNAVKYGDDAVISVINKSMTSNWAGLFFDKLGNSAVQKPTAKEDDRWAAFDARWESKEGDGTI